MWLRVRIIATFLMCAALPLLAGIAAMSVAATFVLGDAARRDLRSATDALSLALEDRLAYNLRHLKAWGAMPVMQDALIADDGGDIARVLAGLKEQHPDFADLYATDGRGIVIASTSPQELQLDLANNEGFRAAASGRPYQSAYGLRRTNAPETIWFMVPLVASYDRQTVIGTLTGVLDMTAVTKAVVAQSTLATQTHAAVVATQSGGSIVFSSRQDPELVELLGSIGDHNTGGTAEILLRKEPQFVASVLSKGTALPRDPGFVVRGVAAASDTHATAEFLVAVATAIAIIAAVATLYLAWRWSTPLVQLGAAMTRFSRGDMNAKAPETAQGQTFDDMARAFESFRQTKSVHDWLVARERELQRQKDDANKMMVEKSAHLASLARVLKSQMSTILDLAQSINSENLKSAVAGKHPDGKAQDISTAAMRLIGVINDLFDLSEAEAGHLSMKESEVDLSTLAQECVLAVSDAAQKAKVTVIGIAADSVVNVRLDIRLMKQVMSNLLSNAIKFTPAAGRVRVGVKVAHDGRPSITIEDSGFGMPANLAPMAAGTSNPGDPMAHGRHGAGLGLPIARKLVAMHGGTIEIESEAGKGTTVTVALAANRLVAQEEKPAERLIA